MKKSIFTTILILLFTTGFLRAQNGDNLDNIHLFQSFFRDATIAPGLYGEGVLQFSDYDGANISDIFPRGAMPINPQIEIGGRIGFRNISPDVGDGQSGITDLLVNGRYQFKPGQPTQMSAGGYLTLPIGEEKIGEGNLDFGAFWAIRHDLQGLQITGTAGLDFIETTTTTYNNLTNQFEKDTSHKTSLNLGGGLIYPLSEALNLVPELVIQTETNYTALSGGIDYLLQGGGRLRGALILGLDNGAPDLALAFSYFMSFP
jgi:hypothetical protein